MAQPLTPSAIAAHEAKVREFLRQKHIAIAKLAKAQVEAKQGRHPGLTIVDGRRRALETSVKPGGIIAYSFDPTRLVVADSLRFLREISPVDRSHRQDDRVFKDSFIILADGAAVDVDQIPYGAEVAILNRQRYDGKLERGWSLQAPIGVYQRVAVPVMRARWRRLAEISFDWISGPAGEGRHPALIIKGRVIR